MARRSGGESAAVRRSSFGVAAGLLTSLWSGVPAAQQQVDDPDFKVAVANPAYSQGGPTVGIDEAHSNFHTATGRYRPFAELLQSDGYRVRSVARRLDAGTLAEIDVLVVANALGDKAQPGSAAFAEAECDILRDWVQGGGALLLVADHTPFGSAAESLAARFGVSMGKGYAFARAPSGGVTTQLTFSRENGLLGNHSIMKGRGASEAVTTLRSFTGQSLSVPAGAAVLMRLGPNVREAEDTDNLDAEDAAGRGTGSAGSAAGSRSVAAGGRAQRIALALGKGRVVVLGEAGMLSAQLVRYPDGQELRFGMNVPGNDNRQFALNVAHWLSRLFD
jgi:hypothetical protein